MALLLPNLRQVLKYGSGIKDGATRSAVTALEAWSDELIRRLSKLEQSAGGGVAETRAINTTSPLAGGGDLSSDRTLTVADNSTASKGVVAVAPNDTTKFWRGDASWAVPLAPVLARLAFTVPGYGALVFDGVNTVAGVVPSSGVYALSQDIFAEAITVEAGVEVNTNDYRFACTGTFINNGIVRNNGANGANGSGGTGLGGNNGAAGVYWIGGHGGNGGTGAATAAGPMTNVIRLVPVYETSTANIGGAQNGNGGNGNVTGRGGGGGGGWCCGATGGNAGTMTQHAATFGNATLLDLIQGTVTHENTTTPMYWTVSSGGGGGGGTAGNAGGGGGGGAGVLFCAAGSFEGIGVFRARGGDGGNGQLNGSNGTGGGGGGGGGLVILLGANNGAYSTDVAGGTGGLGAESSPAAGNGGDGADGYVVELD